MALRRALDAYQELPLIEHPGCYVATAAANGAPWIVRSRPVTTVHGERRINRQLQILKVGEIALKVAHPGLHRRLRSIYDVVGPPIAAQLSSPTMASAAYLLLLPISWVTEVTLRIAAPGIETRITRLLDLDPLAD